VAATERRAAQGSPAGGRMDLLTVVMHELGHIIGHDDIPSADAPHTLMADELPLGVRHTPEPAAGAAEAAPSLSGGRAVVPSSVKTTSSSVQANVGTLPAAKRVVVTFDVVIGSPLPAGVSQVSNQARITLLVWDTIGPQG
jgi:hypothetical protein